MLYCLFIKLSFKLLYHQLGHHVTNACCFQAWRVHVLYMNMHYNILYLLPSATYGPMKIREAEDSSEEYSDIVTWTSGLNRKHVPLFTHCTYLNKSTLRDSSGLSSSFMPKRVLISARPVWCGWFRIHCMWNWANSFVRSSHTMEGSWRLFASQCVKAVT